MRRGDSRETERFEETDVIVDAADVPHRVSESLRHLNHTLSLRLRQKLLQSTVWILTDTSNLHCFINQTLEKINT